MDFSLTLDGYLLWSIIGGIGAIILVILSYMGFFSSVVCTAEDINDILLAYENFEAPYAEMPKQCRLFKKKLVEICGESVDFVKQINIYYDDPRFITHHCRWGIAYEIPEDIVDLLALNGISFVRIPAGKCLSVVFPYRNALSYGLGARKAFDTMVATADKYKLTICTPPMEIDLNNSQTIQYILYLDNLDVIQSMCESPFTDVYRTHLYH